MSEFHTLSILVLPAVLFGGCHPANDTHATGTVRLELMQATKTTDEGFTVDWRITNESDRTVRSVSLAVVFRNDEMDALGLENVYVKQLAPHECDVDSFTVSNVNLDDIAEWDAHLQLAIDDATGEHVQGKYGVDVSFED